MNNFMLVGRIEKTEEMKDYTVITIAVNQQFKNANGEYETNHININTYGTVSERTMEYCKIGDVIGAKRRLQKLDGDDSLKLIADRVTFLSTRKVGN